MTNSILAALIALTIFETFKGKAAQLIQWVLGHFGALLGKAGAALTPEKKG